jgi:hypothetical protein
MARSARIGPLIIAALVVVLVGGTLAAVVASASSHPAPSASAASLPTNVRTIPIAASEGQSVGTPGLSRQYSCAGSTCLLATWNAQGMSSLWASTNASLTFAAVPLPSDAFVPAIACQSPQVCYVLAESSLGNSGTGQLFETNPATSAGLQSVVVTAGYEPSTLDCVPFGPCWTTGTRRGTTAGYVRLTPRAPWEPIQLPDLASAERNAIACANASLCVDVVSTLPPAQGATATGSTNGPFESGAYEGSLLQGFATVLARPSPDAFGLQASCDPASCWFIENPVASGGVLQAGELTTAHTTAVTIPAPSPTSELRGLACSSSFCLAQLSGATKTVSVVFQLGARPRALTLPSSLAAEELGLFCTPGATECIATATPGSAGPGLIIHVAPGGNRLAVGSSISLGQQLGMNPSPANLTSCLPSICFEVLEAARGPQLVSFHNLATRPSSSEVVRLPNAAVLLSPIALSCPTTSVCDLLTGSINGPTFLVELAHDHVVADHTLPPGTLAQGLACPSAHHCVVAVAGISHHYGFPVLVTSDAGATFRRASIANAPNDISVLSIACPSASSCVAIAEHDFALGYGSIAPAIAASSDGGRSWHLVRVSGPQPKALATSPTTALSCYDTRCVSVVSASNLLPLTGLSTLVYTGTATGSGFTVHQLHLAPPASALPINAALACNRYGCLLSLTVTSLPLSSTTRVVALAPSGTLHHELTVPRPEPAGLGATASAFLATAATASAWLVPARA